MNWLLFNPIDELHNRLLDRFLQNTKLPLYLSSRKTIKLDKIYDDPAGRFWLCLDGQGAVCGFSGIYVLTDSNGIRYAKYPYRQYFNRENTLGLKSPMFDLNFENLMESWQIDHPDIPILVTINEGNERVFFYTSKRIKRFESKYSDSYCQFNKSLKLLPYYINEMNTWQMALTYNYENINRESKPFSSELIVKINDLWKNNFWYGAAGRGQL